MIVTAWTLAVREMSEFSNKTTQDASFKGRKRGGGGGDSWGVQPSVLWPTDFSDEVDDLINACFNLPSHRHGARAPQAAPLLLG